ncbi:MAG: hypothetical protein V3T31_02095 [candidate division Zixibacteria bacterium]
MDFSTFLWTTLGAFLTLATFSFLYKDNPFYRFAEHLVVGVSTGYFTVVVWHGTMVPNLFARLTDGDWYFFWLNSARWWYVIPMILGLLMWTRFSRKYGWVSRWPLALYIGIGAGVAVPLEMSNRVNKQLYASIVQIDWSNFWGAGILDPFSGFSSVLVFVGVMAALIYFFFSKAHTGVFGGVAKLGIWTLMIGFGASFGFTVMARISLLINRIQYLDQNWMQNAFNTDNENYSAKFQIVFWLVIVLIVGYVVREVLLHLKTRPESTEG